MTSPENATPLTPRGSMRRVDWETFRRIAADASTTLPIEQTAAWDAFDAAMDGREPWGRLVYQDADGAPRALISLTRMDVRGFPYLWARHAPVWLGAAPSPQEEAELRELVVAGVRVHDPAIVFVRLHFTHPAAGLHELLQTMTYDRTVILDVEREDDEAFLASFKPRGRRDVRKALRNTELTYHDETDIAEEVFAELYEILTETGDRDGFRAAPEDTYRTMLRTLGPEHCRLYVARRGGQEALAWSIDTIWGDGAARYYAASTAEGRRGRAADALLYKEGCWLRQRGVRTWDLMGAGSERVPELDGVGSFKAKFTPAGAVDIPGAWDVPVRPRIYAGLVRALELKHRAQAGVSAVRERLAALRTTSAAEPEQ
ncbi:lipid II:glycine glycyltransferase FemX [Actinomyces sp. MRS3W]|uniref:lipid II:glycine glycyltransferase FemX n=1 Tax=Actinomyces sp. MRS3W TaxID=2800796 RepID=UPI0028FD855A|nr:GNAT family N-acetyltransferase [Actinomyces sp. MRS3W]MDU0349037.1 GNAT family N-acetyltransferase [Actinomyces sp. MRS3W]